MRLENAGLGRKMRKSSLSFFKLAQYLVIGASIIGALYFIFFHKNYTSIRSIPAQDRQRIELFFRFLVQEDCVGHTLFGNKPMSVIGIFDPHYRTNDNAQKMYALNTQNVLKKIGLDTWLKYQHLFPSNNFQFVVKQEEEFLEVYIINKKEFLSTVRSNIKELCEKLGRSFTAEEFLENFIKEKDSSSLLKSQSVLGILLGYGKENAELFERLCALKKWNPYFGYSLRKPKLVPSSSFATIDEELKFIEKNFTSFLDNKMINFPVIFMVPLGFRANPSSAETQRLKKQYHEEYRNIVRVYREGDFLETTLKQFMK